MSRLADVTETTDKVLVTVESLVTGEKEALAADALVYATGYRSADGLGLLGDVEKYCRRDDLGRVGVARDYRVQSEPELRCGIYLQGGTEHTHGITSSLLSNTAIRVGEILRSIVTHGRVPVPASHTAPTPTP